MQAEGPLGLPIMLQRTLIMLQAGKNFTDYVASKKEIFDVSI